MSNHTSATKIGEFITVLKTVESTNNYAMGMVHEGLAKHGDGWFALEQTAGKGQRNKGWKTTTGENIILSLIVEPSLLTISQQFALSMAIALGCYDFFNSHAGDETSIKWPNDIYWRDRKAGGILIENIIKADQWAFAVVGIGLNVNQTHFADDLANPVSLKQITGKTMDLSTATRQLCNYLETRFIELQQGVEHTHGLYNQVLFKRGQTVKLKKETAVFETQVTGVSASGKLLTTDTMNREFDLGEIKWIL